VAPLIGAETKCKDDGDLTQALLAQEVGVLERVRRTVRKVAAEEIMPRFLHVAHSRKADGSLFTEADLASQEALVRALGEIRQVPVIGEEMTEAEHGEQWLAGDAGLWCVDPIDGTSNFVNGVPFFAVSVALMQGGRSMLGVVYDPVADEMFSAERGRGAFLNGERLPLRPGRSRLRGAIAGIDFKRLSKQLACALAAEAPYASQRNFGAGTLDWCYAAAGRFDVYLHGGQKLWDYAAGAIILEEAGGSACTLTHDAFWSDHLWLRSVIASCNPALFVQWRDWIRARL
jgi:myo-inositol-1(or 4)-monophosphatase